MRNAICAVLLAASSVSAQSIRDVQVTERTVTTINARLRYTSSIVLPEGETILQVLCGDADWWDIVYTGNVAHVKPAKEGGQTNLTLVTDRALRSFLLVEGKGLADLRVHVDGGSDATGAPKYYTRAHVEALSSRVEAAESRLRDVLQSQERKSQAPPNVAPSALSFPFSGVRYARPFLVRSIYHDDRFTYIHTDAKELPSLYEVKDGKPALVNFQVPRPGLYVVPKVLDRAYLSLGKNKLEFKRDGN